MAEQVFCSCRKTSGRSLQGSLERGQGAGFLGLWRAGRNPSSKQPNRCLLGQWRPAPSQGWPWQWAPGDVGWRQGAVWVHVLSPVCPPLQNKREDWLPVLPSPSEHRLASVARGGVVGCLTHDQGLGVRRQLDTFAAQVRLQEGLALREFSLPSPPWAWPPLSLKFPGPSPFWNPCLIFFHPKTHTLLGWTYYISLWAGGRQGAGSCTLGLVQNQEAIHCCWLCHWLAAPVRDWRMNVGTLGDRDGWRSLHTALHTRPVCVFLPLGSGESDGCWWSHYSVI